MAYKDSDQIANDSNYALGDYSFRIERSSVPGSTNDQITAICTQGGKNARKSIQIPSSQNLEGWYVDANSTTADVYAVIRVPSGDSEKTSDLDTGNISQPIPVASVLTRHVDATRYTDDHTYHGSGFYESYKSGNNWTRMFIASNSDATFQIDTVSYNKRTGETTTSTSNDTPGSWQTFEHEGKTAYYAFANTITSQYGTITIESAPTKPGEVAWTALYGTSSGTGSYDLVEKLIGRFAIELEDAGGVGPGSDWEDPGDWNEDPTTTLHLTIDGALSGRHNDPLNDTSYSYIPSDKATVKDYGCGGDGGNGGGGGGGASSIVVYKFATDKANWKEIVCKPKRHGYGSGGGKGGKGGDGCILVYY